MKSHTKGMIVGLLSMAVVAGISNAFNISSIRKEAAQELQEAKEALKNTRPKVGTDHMAQCLWAMERTYQGGCPKGMTRPDFIFKCLDEYPKTLDSSCISKYGKCEEKLLGMTAKFRNAQNSCKRYCMEARKKDEYTDSTCQTMCE